MNNLAKILEKIEAEGTRQIEDIRKACDEKLAALDAETAAAVSAWEDAHKVETEKEANAIRTREKANAAMQCREIVLTEKASRIAEVYQKAEQVILSLPADEYAAFLTNLASSAITERVETVRFLQTEYRDEAFAENSEVYSLHFSAKDKETYGASVLTAVQKQVAAVLPVVPEIRLGDEVVPISGGVVVRYGDTETNCALSVLLSGLREKMDPVVQKTLFS